MEIRDFIIESDIFCSITLHSKVTKSCISQIFLEEWDEDDSAELLDDDIPSCF